MTDDRQHASTGRLVAVELDTGAMRRSTPAIDYERAAAMRDLIANNVFEPVGRTVDRFRLRLSVADRRLVFDIRDEDDRPLVSHILSMTPLMRVMRDYYVVCDAYYAAAGSSSPAQFEAIDMGRRGLHNEGAELLLDRLKGKIDLDQTTARCLFTLVAAIYWKG